MSETAVKEKIEQGTVAPFAVEADHPRNCDLLLQSVPGARLRSAIDGTKSIVDAKTGDIRVPLDQSRYLASFPKTPGMQIHVNPAKCEYIILDPLEDDKNAKARERIKSFLAQHGQRVDAIKGVPMLRGKLDIHRMKTLCRELLWIVEAGEGKIVLGPTPAIQDIDKLPGHFLLNPGSRVMNTQPMYEKDWDKWFDQLVKSGG